MQFLLQEMLHTGKIDYRLYFFKFLCFLTLSGFVSLINLWTQRTTSFSQGHHWNFHTRPQLLQNWAKRLQNWAKSLQRRKSAPTTWWVHCCWRGSILLLFSKRNTAVRYCIFGNPCRNKSIQLPGQGLWSFVAPPFPFRHSPFFRESFICFCRVFVCFFLPDGSNILQ